MALAAKLNLRQTQSMVMTPQLLQSIRLLQFTQLELDRFVRDQIETNPLLDQGETSDGGDPASTDIAEPPQSDEWSMEDLQTSSAAIADTLDTTLENVFPDDPGTQAQSTVNGLSGDAGPRAGPALLSDTPGEIDFESFVAGKRSLRDLVVEQISLSISDPERRAIAYELADTLDANGYTDPDFGEIAVRLGCGAEDILSVLGSVQGFDPPGIFARDLGECLALQLRRRDRYDPAMAELIANLPLLARRDFKSLSRICGVDEGDLVDMLAEIRALDPKPGLAFDETSAETIVHDVEVREAADRSWHIELNADALPRVIVDRDYYAKVTRNGLSAEEKLFMSDCLQNATWLERSLSQRAGTILKVATEIVKQQDGFLQNGVRALKPMTMRQVAEAINMHESTISRVSANKFMLTPRGVFEFRYFFTVALGAGDGDDAGHSSESVRQRIRVLIDQEAANAVLSDDALVTILRKEGVDIARRTVAKYREGMNIASSVQRRREKRALAAASV
ncbi:RNA polymerase factor sigma-54 [Oricola sp.]|uniref:RNA polymerase factor sigma-54 n=1 Tax=Oricola sp. TaxID=1979950 RepID=UPI003BAA46F8